MNQNEVQTFDAADIEKNKVISALAYLGILFFLPLVACPDSKFGRFHANQGLVLLIVSVVGGFIFGIISSLIPIIGVLLSGLYSLAMFVLLLYGLINTLQGHAKQLPVIGQFTILK